MCGLKQVGDRLIEIAFDSHTLTGVWIETMVCIVLCVTDASHTLTGVWIETAVRERGCIPLCSHTLTGVWIET